MKKESYYSKTLEDFLLKEEEKADIMDGVAKDIKVGKLTDALKIFLSESLDIPYHSSADEYGDAVREFLKTYN